jgi:hypothetical protein
MSTKQYHAIVQHVEMMELHDGVMIAECCLSDVFALAALVCVVMTTIVQHYVIYFRIYQVPYGTRG